MSTLVQEQMFNPGEADRRRGSEGTRHLSKKLASPTSTRYPDCICPRVKQLEQLMAFDISDECGQLACDMDEEEEEEQL